MVPIYKEDQNKDLELQTYNYDIGAGEGYGGDHQCHYVAHTMQSGNETQSVWVYER